MKKLLIVVLMLIAAGCTKPEDKIKKYLANGKSLYEAGEYNKAKIEFKNVLQLDSKQPEAFYQLALIDEHNKNWQGMYANLTQVIRHNPKHIDAQLKLARLNLLANQFDESLQHIESVLKDFPNNPDALALKGAVLVKKNNLDGALAIAEQILKDQPNHTDAISLQTIIYLTKQDFAKAHKIVDQALKRNPSETALLQLKLQIHNQSKDMAAVEQDYLDLIKQFPDKLDYKYALAKHYADNNQHDKALSTLQSIVDTYPEKVQPKLVLIDYQMQHSPEMAEKSLTTYISQLPDKPELLFRAVGHYIKQNKIAEAKQTLKKIVDLKSNVKSTINATMMLAKLAIQENDMDTAKSYIKEVLAADKNNLDAHLLKAKFDLQNGLTDEVISNLRGVLRDFSNSDEAHVLLGQAYIKQNSPQLAEENFRKALAINPANFEALMPVISNMVKNDDTRRAEELLQNALTAKPDHAAALQTLAQLKMSQKDWVGAQKIADTIAAKPESKGFGKFLSGKISENRNLCKEAIGLYKEALSISPELIDALQGLASCFSELKQVNSMYAYLDDFMAAHPDVGYAPLLKSQLLSKDKRYDDALKVLTTALTKWPKATELYEASANIYAQKKDYDLAISTLTKGIVNSNDPVRLNLMLASFYEQSGAFDKALTTYETLIKDQPNVDVAVNNLVALLLDHFNSKENIERAVTLAKRFEKSQQPYFLDTYGWALLNSDRNEEALQVFKSVVSKMPNAAPVFKYHLAMAYQKTGNKADAIKELEQALDMAKKSGSFAEKEAAEKLLSSLK